MILTNGAAMSDRTKLDTLIGPHESVRLMNALSSGISRRDMLKMLTAAGMKAAMAGGIATLAGNAYAQQPRKGGKIRVASATAAVSDTLDPSKQSNQTD